MSLTNLRLTVRGSRTNQKKQMVDFLVDSGALYSVIDKSILKKLGVQPTGTKTFFLANNSSVDRKIGEAYFEYEADGATSRVIFGEPGDSNLLGVTTLENLGYVLDPLQRKLLHLPMLLAAIKNG